MKTTTRWIARTACPPGSIRAMNSPPLPHVLARWSRTPSPLAWAQSASIAMAGRKRPGRRPLPIEEGMNVSRNSISLARSCLLSLRGADLSVTEIQDALDEFADSRALSYCIEQLRRQGRLVRANPGVRPARYHLTPAGEQHLMKPASNKGRPRGQGSGQTANQVVSSARRVPNSVFSLGHFAGATP